MSNLTTSRSSVVTLHIIGMYSLLSFVTAVEFMFGQGMYHVSMRVRIVTGPSCPGSPAAIESIGIDGDVNRASFPPWPQSLAQSTPDVNREIMRSQSSTAPGSTCILQVPGQLRRKLVSSYIYLK
jgi:hypothetical protein